MEFSGYLNLEYTYFAMHSSQFCYPINFDSHLLQMEILPYAHHSSRAG
jgi:hypothetical protein